MFYITVFFYFGLNKHKTFITCSVLFSGQKIDFYKLREKNSAFHAVLSSKKGNFTQKPIKKPSTKKKVLGERCLSDRYDYSQLTIHPAFLKNYVGSV